MNIETKDSNEVAAIRVIFPLNNNIILKKNLLNYLSRGGNDVTYQLDELKKIYNNQISHYIDPYYPNISISSSLSLYYSKPNPPIFFPGKVQLKIFNCLKSYANFENFNSSLSSSIASTSAPTLTSTSISLSPPSILPTISNFIQPQILVAWIRPDGFLHGHQYLPFIFSSNLLQEKNILKNDKNFNSNIKNLIKFKKKVEEDFDDTNLNKYHTQTFCGHSFIIFSISSSLSSLSSSFSSKFLPQHLSEIPSDKILGHITCLTGEKEMRIFLFEKEEVLNNETNYGNNDNHTRDLKDKEKEDYQVMENDDDEVDDDNERIIEDEVDIEQQIDQETEESLLKLIKIEKFLLNKKLIIKNKILQLKNEEKEINNKLKLIKNKKKLIKRIEDSDKSNENYAENIIDPLQYVILTPYPFTSSGYTKSNNVISGILSNENLSVDIEYFIKDFPSIALTTAQSSKCGASSSTPKNLKDFPLDHLKMHRMIYVRKRIENFEVLIDYEIYKNNMDEYGELLIEDDEEGKEIKEVNRIENIEEIYSDLIEDSSIFLSYNFLPPNEGYFLNNEQHIDYNNEEDNKKIILKEIKSQLKCVNFLLSFPSNSHSNSLSLTSQDSGSTSLTSSFSTSSPSNNFKHLNIIHENCPIIINSSLNNFIYKKTSSKDALIIINLSKFFNYFYGEIELNQENILKFIETSEKIDDILYNDNVKNELTKDNTSYIFKYSLFSCNHDDFIVNESCYKFYFNNFTSLKEEFYLFFYPYFFENNQENNYLVTLKIPLLSTMHYHSKNYIPPLHDTVYAIIDHPRDLIRLNDLEEEICNENEGKNLDYQIFNKQNCVEILNISLFLKNKDFWSQGGSLLHEISHFYHDYILDYSHSLHSSYFQQLISKNNLYNSVDFHSGRSKGKHYALSNCMEFFAELSVAYFYKFISLNDEEIKDFIEFEKEKIEKKNRFVKYYNNELKEEKNIELIEFHEDELEEIDLLNYLKITPVELLDSKKVNKLLYLRIKRFKRIYGEDSIIIKKQSKLEKERLNNYFSSISSSLSPSTSSLLFHNKLYEFLQDEKFSIFRYKKCYDSLFNSSSTPHDHQEDEYNKWFPYNRFHIFQADPNTYELLHYLWNLLDKL